LSVAFFHGDKGGVGKSTIAAACAEYILSRTDELAVVECDTQNPDLARYMKDLANVYRVDLRAEAGWVEFFNVLDEEPATDIIVSLPAGIGTAFKNQAPDLLAALAGTGRTGGIVWTMGRTADSVALLRDVIDVYVPMLSVVAVRNLYHTGGDPTRFTRWESSKTRAALLGAGGSEINFPELMDALFDLTFGAATPQRFSARAPRYGDRLKLERWLKDAFEAFDGIAAKLSIGAR
jgi:hypothetical protein